MLITGASGTGKEVAAKTIHRLSRRATTPFVAFNCGAISPTLIESELFGHERGSFTGADKRRVGYFEEANGGTLFLDEITEMGSELQVKLLRVLEAKTVRRVGGSQDIRGRRPARVGDQPGSAGGDPGREAARGPLLPVERASRSRCPRLSERREDIPLLAEHFRKLIEEQEKAGVSGWDPKALAILQKWDWPGNVRELRNVVHRAYVMTEGDTITPGVVAELLPEAARAGARRRRRPPRPRRRRPPRKSPEPRPRLARVSLYSPCGAELALERKRKSCCGPSS